MHYRAGFQGGSVALGQIEQCQIQTKRAVFRQAAISRDCPMSGQDFSKQDKHIMATKLKPSPIVIKSPSRFRIKIVSGFIHFTL
ncbi:MAG: hypothetical protein KA524_08420 [Nitrosomonas sp.]|nr:hypothetical protein [Nitrosomonas sp.]MBP6076970.1 hypothetical protein [Nitrosomonas sp.]